MLDQRFNDYDWHEELPRTASFQRKGTSEQFRHFFKASNYEFSVFSTNLALK